MNSLNNRPVVIGVDHGFGNIKTAHTCFKTGVTAHDKEPTFKNDLLIYEGRYYTIGEEHKEFIADKAGDQDRSYSSAIVTAINDYFSRQERLAADPFLETQERQETFLEEVKATIRESLQTSGVGLGGLAALLQGAPPATPPPEAMSEEAFDTAMDFINGL